MRPVSPAANAFGKATVIDCEIVPSASIVKDSTMKVRITSLRDASGSGRRSAAAATTFPPRIQQSNTAPVVAHSAPGMMKAARQPIACASAPATNAAAARPMLPAIPLTPSARPRFLALRTSHAVPTG